MRCCHAATVSINTSAVLGQSRCKKGEQGSFSETLVVPNLSTRVDSTSSPLWQAKTVGKPVGLNETWKRVQKAKLMFSPARKTG
jgi:hypothetical protein